MPNHELLQERHDSTADELELYVYSINTSESFCKVIVS